MFNETAFFLRNIDTKKKRIKRVNGNITNMPADDGYDEAFFFYLRDTTMSFEWLLYNTIGEKCKRGDNVVSYHTMYKKMVECGYSANFLDYNLYQTEKNVAKYLDGVKEVLKKHGLIS